MTFCNSDTWIGTSWKMNKTLAEAIIWSAGIKDFLSVNKLSVQPFVVPPFTVLRKVAQQFIDSPMLIGAQNMHWKDSGPWTGEISAPTASWLRHRLHRASSRRAAADGHRKIPR